SFRILWADCSLRFTEVSLAVKHIIQLDSSIRDIVQPDSSIFLQASLHQVKYPRWYMLKKRPVRLSFQNQCRSLSERFGMKPASSGQNFKKNTAKRPHVDLLVNRFPLELLGAHICCSSSMRSNAVGSGQGRRTAEVCRSGIDLKRARQAKIQQLHLFV